MVDSTSKKRRLASAELATAPSKKLRLVSFKNAKITLGAGHVDDEGNKVVKPLGKDDTVSEYVSFGYYYEGGYDADSEASIHNNDSDHDNRPSSNRPNVFPRYPNLPTELRDEIWDVASKEITPEGRVLRVLHDPGEEDGTASYTSTTPFSQRNLTVSEDSRKAVVKAMRPFYKLIWGTTTHPASIMAHPILDLPFIGAENGQTGFTIKNLYKDLGRTQVRGLRMIAVDKDVFQENFQQNVNYFRRYWLEHVVVVHEDPKKKSLRQPVRQIYKAMMDLSYVISQTWDTGNGDYRTPVFCMGFMMSDTRRNKLHEVIEQAKIDVKEEFNFVWTADPRIEPSLEQYHRWDARKQVLSNLADLGAKTADELWWTRHVPIIWLKPSN